MEREFRKQEPVLVTGATGRHNVCTLDPRQDHMKHQEYSDQVKEGLSYGNKS